jgi:adenosine deaminase
MSDAFQIFALTHSVVTDPAAVYRVTKEVIEDFAADGVVYLELRTVKNT